MRCSLPRPQAACTPESEHLPSVKTLRSRPWRRTGGASSNRSLWRAGGARRPPRRCSIGRLSNLYGPGQKLSKRQGLITQVCLRVLSRQPVVLYVPLDTIRDYLFAKDAGALVADGLTRLRHETSQPVATTAVVKILASQQPTTVSTVLAQLRWVTKRPVRVIIAESPNAARQARDLRMTSSVWPDLDRRPMTTLSEGMRWVLTDILNSSARGRSDLDALATANA